MIETLDPQACRSLISAIMKQAADDLQRRAESTDRLNMFVRALRVLDRKRFGMPERKNAKEKELDENAVRTLREFQSAYRFFFDEESNFTQFCGWIGLDRDAVRDRITAQLDREYGSARVAAYTRS